MSATKTRPRTRSRATDPQEVAQRFRRSLMRLSRILRQNDSDDLSPTLASTLFTIARQGPLTSGEIARRERMKKPSVTAAVDRLAERGLIERRADTSDGRIVWVAITDEGRRKVDARRASRTAWLASRFVHLPPSDLAALSRAAEIVEELIAQGDESP